jgi:hypothetical protein
MIRIRTFHKILSCWILPAILDAVVVAVPAAAQTADAYKVTADDQKSGGLLDPKKLTVNHSVSYGMSTVGNSPIKSQGLYTTMLAYKFSQPVTLNLNFGFPLFSSYSSAQNLTSQNLQSFEYFKSMPMDMSLTWQPRENLLFNFSVVRNPGYGYGYGYGYDPFMSYFSPMYNRAIPDDRAKETSPK